MKRAVEIELGGSFIFFQIIIVLLRSNYNI